MKQSSQRDPGFVKLRRGLLPHLYYMSSNAVKLYVCLLLKAHWKPGPKRGWVEVSYEDIAHDLGWSYSTVRRTVGELARKSYIEVTPAANQYELTRIKIFKYDVEESNPAPFTGEHTKTAESSGAPSGALSAVSTAERSTEHSNPFILESELDLHAPKNAVEVKKKKKVMIDAVRRPFDAELRIASPPLDGKAKAKPSERKAKLTPRLAKAIRVHGNQFEGGLDRDEYAVLQAALNATDYEAKDSMVITDGFIYTLMEVFEKHKNDGTSPGNLCSKVIDGCLSQQEGCKNMGADPSEYYWPPDFQENRDRLRERERLAKRQTN